MCTTKACFRCVLVGYFESDTSTVSKMMSSNSSDCNSPMIKSYYFLLALSNWEKYLIIVCGCLCITAFIILVDNIVFLCSRYHNHLLLVTSIWLVGLSPVLSIVSLLAMLVPNVFIFRDVLMSVCLSIVMYKFLQLLIAYTDEFDSIREQIISHHQLRFNVRPLCCMCSCLPTTRLSRSNFRALKILVLQYPILVVAITVLTMTTWLDGTYVPGVWSTRNPFPYLSVIRVTSVVLAIYALSILVGICKGPMKSLYINQKYSALSISMFLFSIQGLIFDILTFNGVFDFRTCLAARVMGNFYENLTYCVEMFLLTLFNLWVYRRTLSPGPTRQTSSRVQPHVTPSVTVTLEAFHKDNQTVDKNDNRPSEISQSRDTMGDRPSEISQSRDTMGNRPSEISQSRDTAGNRPSEISQSRDTAGSRSSEVSQVSSSVTMADVAIQCEL